MCRRKDPAFISRGFRNWKKTGERFLEHQTSDCDKVYKKLLDIADDEVGVGEQMSDSLVNEKAKIRQKILTILQNIQFLARQGFAFRGNEDHGNFGQLMKLSSNIDPRIISWTEKKRNKYLHNDWQNEILKLMAFTMLRDIAKNIDDNVLFSIMADEVTDSNNNEQLVICIRWVDNNFEVHEDFIGIHVIENIKSNTLVTVLKDILIRLNIPL